MKTNLGNPQLPVFHKSSSREQSAPSNKPFESAESAGSASASTEATGDGDAEVASLDIPLWKRALDLTVIAVTLQGSSAAPIAFESLHDALNTATLESR